MDKFNASCHCGKVKLSFSQPVKMVVQCHCQNCRKMQGADYSTWIAVSDDQFSIDVGSEYISLYEFNEKSTKSFCSSCGTAIFGVNEKHFHKHKMIPLGLVDNYSTEIKPQFQVYTADKAKWVKTQEEVPIYMG